MRLWSVKIFNNLTGQAALVPGTVQVLLAYQAGAVPGTCTHGGWPIQTALWIGNDHTNMTAPLPVRLLSEVKHVRACLDSNSLGPTVGDHVGIPGVVLNVIFCAKAFF